MILDNMLAKRRTLKRRRPIDGRPPPGSATARHLKAERGETVNAAQSATSLSPGASDDVTVGANAS
jgi:hypothetical protein